MTVYKLRSGILTCALWWLSTQRDTSSQDPDQCRGQLHASGAPPVKPGPQQNGKISHLQMMTWHMAEHSACLQTPEQSNSPSHRTNDDFSNDYAQFSQELCNLTSWGISWSRMAKVVRNPTCKKSQRNTALSYLFKKCALYYREEKVRQILLQHFSSGGNERNTIQSRL